MAKWTAYMGTAPRSLVRRAGAAIVAVLAAAWMAASSPVRRLIGGRARGGSRLTVWSMKRPSALGSRAPNGSQARVMPGDNVQCHPGYDVTVERVISIFGMAEVGYPREQCDLFDDLVEGNCHARSLFVQRAQAVAGKPWVVQPGDAGDEAVQAARAFSFALRRLRMMDFFTHQLSANKYGFAATEVDWGLCDFEGRTWVVPVWLANVGARRFLIDVANNELRLITAAAPARGEDLIPGKWVVTTLPGPLARAGLMRSGTAPLCYIRWGVTDWVVYCHKFGLPLVLAKYGGSEEETENDGTTDDATRKVLEDIVRNFGQDGGGVVSKSVDVDIKDANGGDATKMQGALVAYCNSEISKLVNGSTLANDNAGSGGASYALGEVHASVRWDNIQADAARLEEAVLTQLAGPFVRFNRITCAAPVLRIQVVRDLTPKVRAEVTDIYVNKLGGKASATQMAEELGYRDPLDDGDVLPGPQAAPAATAPEQTKAAA